MKEEEGRRNAAVDSFRVVERSAKELKEKLTRGEELRRSVESTLKGYERQAESQRLLLCDTEDQLAIAKE